jgi:hypothetical protein
MSNAVLKGNASGTGTVTLETPNTNSDLTISMPAAAGTMMVSGNMPAFSAFSNSAQTLSAATTTKIQINTEEFDTASAFDNTTNYRFTPQVAGYYQVNCNFAIGTITSNLQAYIYKNGASFKVSTNPSSGGACGLSALIYLNGSTDYIEFYAFSTAANIVVTGASQTYFQAVLVRAA